VNFFACYKVNFYYYRSVVCKAHEGRHVRILHEFICIGKDQTNIPERKRIFTPRNLALNIDKPDVIYQFNICN
jgi:hypothetical protein